MALPGRLVDRRGGIPFIRGAGLPFADLMGRSEGILLSLVFSDTRLSLLLTLSDRSRILSGIALMGGLGKGEPKFVCDTGAEVVCSCCPTSDIGVRARKTDSGGYGD